MTLLTVRRGNVYDLYLLDVNGAALEIRRNVDIAEVYALIEDSKRNGIAVVNVD